jgi:hypothetical protein
LEIFEEKKQMVIRHISAALAVVSLGLAVCGCAPSIISPDAGVYSVGKGRLYATSSQDTTSVYAATLKALDELEVNVTDKAKDAFYARVVAKGADGKRITISIKPKEGDGTTFTIKVGIFGEKRRSSIIYERIKQNLTSSGK